MLKKSQDNLVSIDIDYQKFLKMIEKEQKIRDRSYKLWQDTHEISKPRKRKDPLQYQLIGKV